MTNSKNGGERQSRLPSSPRSRAFNGTTITDQKRLVRGEHWLMARRMLRARDGVHHGKWRCLMIAGPNPAEEITCIRELMRNAWVVAADVNPQHIDAAIEAGADDVALCDISDFQKGLMQNKRIGDIPPKEIGTVPFDAICIDMTCSPSEWLANVVKVYSRSRGGILAKGGVFIVNFSYGRDVVEKHLDVWERRPRELTRDVEAVLPELTAARLYMVLGGRINRLRSVLQYKGNQMPMLSCLLTHLPSVSLSFEKIDDADYLLAVTAENLGNIYACPPERLVALRRQNAARKAVLTRTSREIDLFEHSREG